MDVGKEDVKEGTYRSSSMKWIVLGSSLIGVLSDGYPSPSSCV